MIDSTVSSLPLLGNIIKLSGLPEKLTEYPGTLLGPLSNRTEPRIACWLLSVISRPPIFLVNGYTATGFGIPSKSKKLFKK